MSSTNSDTPSNLLEKHIITEIEELLDKITEPHPDITYHLSNKSGYQKPDTNPLPRPFITGLIQK